MDYNGTSLPSEEKTYYGVLALNRSPTSPVEHHLQNTSYREDSHQEDTPPNDCSSSRKSLRYSNISASDQTIVAGNTNLLNIGVKASLSSSASHSNSELTKVPASFEVCSSSEKELKGISIALFSEEFPVVQNDKGCDIVVAMPKELDQSRSSSTTEGYDYSYNEKKSETVTNRQQSRAPSEGSTFGDESGHYLLRQDIFLPHQQKNTTGSSNSMSHNLKFFENIDNMFDECLPQIDITDLYHDGELGKLQSDTNSSATDNSSPNSRRPALPSLPKLDAQELIDISKMCFAATCVVFSSHNPSTTKVKSNADEEEDGQDVDSQKYDRDDSYAGTQFPKKSTLSSAYQHAMEKDVYKSSIFRRHKRRLVTRAEDSHALTVDHVFDTESVSAPPSLKSYKLISRTSTGSGGEGDLASGTGTISVIQRPSVPVAVLYMLWCSLIDTKFRDKNLEGGDHSLLSDKMLSRIFDSVREMLVDKMHLLQVCYHMSKEGSDFFDDKDVGVKDSLEATECLQITHDLHQQYGCYLSENSSLFSFFVRQLPEEQGTQRHNMPYRIYEKETWNPEHALNFVLASCCFSCVNRAKKKENKTNTHQLQYEYSIEMLPWHLLRALCYDTVADLLTDVSFVKGRLSNLDFFDAASMHIADFEELSECVTTIMAENPSLVADIDIDQTMTESYGLLGSLIRSKDVSRWQYEDKSDDASSQIEETIDLNHVRGVARSLEALGDSLFSYNKQSESMKYYYRAMVRYEHITNVEISRFAKENNPSILYNDETQLSMGGVLSRIAAVYECDNEFANAMLCYEKALSYFSRCQSKQHAQGVSKTLASMGELHFTLKEFDSALSCFNEALLMLRSMEDNSDEVVANLLLLIGNVRREMGDLNEALELFSEALYSKVLIYGNSHPEVGFIHHIIGVAFCDKQDFQQAIAHFENALKIRKTAVSVVQSHLPANDKSGRIQSRELEVSESLEFLGKVYETLNDLYSSFIFYEESTNIHHNHLLDLCASDSSTLTMSDIVGVLKSETECKAFVEDVYSHLQSAIQIAFRLCPIGRIFKSTLSVEDMIDIEGQMAEILYDMGLIRGAQFLREMAAFDTVSNQPCAKDFSSERMDFTSHFEDSITLRKRRIEKLLEQGKHGDEEVVNYERITMAITLYELGKLYSWFVMRNDIEEKKPRTLRLISPTRNIALRDCRKALDYFEEAKGILRDSIEMAETLGYTEEDEDVFISRLHLTPTIYEEMLQAMAILYRKLDEYDKSIECYNEFSILSTRMELEDKLDSEPKQSFLAGKKQKVAVASQSIGDILFDTGEFVRALESYDEALKLLRASGADNLVIADTLSRKGTVLLKLKLWNESVLTFNEALGIRVDQLPQDHNEIAETFHSMGKAYEGHEKLEQALDYYKKAQRIVSGRLVDTDTKAADLFLDLGNIVLVQDEAATRFARDKPSEDDISLALTCLALSRDIYTRSFGKEALEVGNALSLLGVIFQKYGEVSVAISSYKKALRIFKGAPLDQSERIRKTLTRLGTSLLEVSAEDNAELFESLGLARELYEDQDNGKSIDYADLIFLFGEAHSKYGKSVQQLWYRIPVLPNLMQYFFDCPWHVL